MDAKLMAVLPLGAAMLASCTPGEEHKNVLFLMVDDMRDWTGYLDGYEARVYTPNIDRLASQGIAFTNAHTAASISCPSRNAIFTGKRPSTTGLYNNDQWWKAVLPEEVTMPQYFKENGYRSVGIGKIFHHTPGNNPPCCWDECKEMVSDIPWNFADWTPEQFFLKYGYRGEIIPYPDWKPGNGLLPNRAELDWGAIPGKAEAEYGDCIAVDNFVEFIERKENKEPFFCAVGIFKPHLPWHVPQKYYDMYPLEDIVLPEVPADDLDDVPAIGKKLAKTRSKDYKYIKNAGKWKEAVQAYLASITFADAQIGKILDALEHSRYGKNTIVVLCSDHGWHLGTKGHWHKSTLWEECTRVPFVIKVPGCEPRFCDASVDLTNIYPTLISLCGLPEKDDLDGYDMTPLITGDAKVWNYPARTEILRGNMAVRDSQWRYIHYSDGGEELYNMADDPNQWYNLADNPEYKAIKDNLKQWVPEVYAESLASKTDFFFDPYAYTYLHKETGQFIDGKK